MIKRLHEKRWPEDSIAYMCFQMKHSSIQRPWACNCEERWGLRIDKHAQPNPQAANRWKLLNKKHYFIVFQLMCREMVLKIIEHLSILSTFLLRHCFMIFPGRGDMSENRFRHCRRRRRFPEMAWEISGRERTASILQAKGQEDERCCFLWVCLSLTFPCSPASLIDERLDYLLVLPVSSQVMDARDWGR